MRLGLGSVSIDAVAGSGMEEVEEETSMVWVSELRLLPEVKVAVYAADEVPAELCSRRAAAEAEASPRLQSTEVSTVSRLLWTVPLRATPLNAGKGLGRMVTYLTVGRVRGLRRRKLSSQRLFRTRFLAP